MVFQSDNNVPIWGLLRSAHLLLTSNHEMSSSDNLDAKFVVWERRQINLNGKFSARSEICFPRSAHVHGKSLYSICERNLRKAVGEELKQKHPKSDIFFMLKWRCTTCTISSRFLSKSRANHILIRRDNTWIHIDCKNRVIPLWLYIPRILCTSRSPRHRTPA